jgi:hypothetical protein
MTRSRAALLLITMALGWGPARDARAESASVPIIQISDVAVVEGDQGETSFTATVTMNHWYGPGPVMVDVTAAPGTADPSDYRVETTRLSFSQAAVPATVTGVVRGDRDYEGDEIFRLQVVSAVGFPYPLSVAGGTVTIRDDDEARASRLAIMGASVMEGNSGTTRAELEVLLAPAATHPVTVDYQVMASSVRGGTLTFAPGQTRQVIAIDVTGDDYWEADERIKVRLQNPGRAAITTAEAELLVRNDDAPSLVQLADVTVTELDGATTPVSLTFVYDRPTPPQSKLWVRTEGGLAVSGRDFQPLADTLYPPPGVTSFTVTLLVLGDATPECDEGLMIEYGGVYTGDESRKTARVLIVDDDGARVGAGPCTHPFTPDPRELPPVLGTDAGVTGTDAGVATTDAPVTADAGTAGGGAGGGATVDAGSSPPLGDDAGGCSLGGGGAGVGCTGLAALALLGLAVWRRGRRSRPVHHDHTRPDPFL